MSWKIPGGLGMLLTAVRQSLDASEQANSEELQESKFSDDRYSKKRAETGQLYKREKCSLR